MKNIKADKENISFENIPDIKDKLKAKKIHIEDNCKLPSNSTVGIYTNIWKNVEIGENTVIERKVSIGEGTIIGSGCTIGEFGKIGKNVVIGNDIVIPKSSVIDDNVILLDTLIIQGSKHQVTYLGNGRMSIGCKIESIDWMLENHESLGIENDYTEAQIEEYFDYMKQVKEYEIIISNN